MRIGVLTFHHVPNYGAVLQAYALCRALAELGHSPELIDYRPASATRYYRRRLNPFRGRRQGFQVRALDELVKSWKTRRFVHDVLPLSKRSVRCREDLRAYARYYDLVIAGSDQIWDVESFRGFDPSFFLDFVAPSTTRRVSYAASFGKTGDLGARADSIGALLRGLDAVSVRDTNSREIVKRVADRDVPLVLDPTFLTTYEDLTVPPSIGEPYLLLHCVGRLRRVQEHHLESVARERGLKIVSVGERYDCADAHPIAVGPREWLGYVQHASYVATNFYHGLIFSLIYQRPFTVFARADKANKVDDLLQRLDVGKRCPYGAVAPAVDYSRVGRRVGSKIARSRAFLRDVVDGAG